MKKLVLTVEEFENKLVVIEDDKIDEILVQRESKIANKEIDIVGNFYKAKIVDVKENIDSVFLDIGFEKNAFLNISKIKNKIKFKVGDSLLVQVKKNSRENKGAELSLDYTISSKNLVLLGNRKLLDLEKFMFSKKIKDNNQVDRIKKIFSEMEDYSLIVRTNAVFVEEEKLLAEYKNLVLKWKNVEKKYRDTKNGKLVYSQNSIVEKIFREYFDENTSELIVDDDKKLIEIKEYLKENNQNSYEKKIKKYYREEDIFKYYSIDTEIEKALNKKVWLDSGGYLIIEKTEALISIDINTGKNLSNKFFEKTIFQTNLEAAIEIPRQLRLRNLAGIIIIDFIDMKKSSQKKEVLKILEENFKRDRLKTSIVNYSSLNLAQLTRERKGNDLDFYYQKKCFYCDGSGKLVSDERIILNILKEIKIVLSDKDIKKIEIRTNKRVIEEIQKNYLNNIEKIEFLEIKEPLIEGYKIDLYK